ncbi:exodeoxyribonuclease VII large subunit [Caldalkalibacillus thermarum TA2.A1]|uniref:Exodeoxyribonuclease 7 large subunit n=1 Tax=Caldalkalibacillus thermarum (strain TA2.A1) TaxID=986075 RepID=A0A8X8I6R1_CALTT|nr:exodeoxyribonuclease VII large subunit [Caldalkalibacillus thermarum]QZT32656.1 exodeoxyribonuclease VII large subunit [Caldalkalibacillus thermarum TA2.A1]
MTGQTIITVQELTRDIKRCFEENDSWRNLWVRGEISNFTHHSRGHMYFTLKDEAAKIRAVMFQSHNRWLKFKPQNGLKVIARGEVNVYERDGQYQLYVKEMQPDGIGALYQAFEELKERLRLKGWFDPSKKKPIPKFPRKIGVITSPTGAAIRDILTTIKRRFPVADVLLIPVQVQGEQAASSVARAIRLAHRYPLDVLIVGRGGGSIEELWAFNEEVVAEAIYQAQIPVISAVGHETDVTIADFVADLRAPTPTAAAELAAPLLTELEEDICQLTRRLYKQINWLVAEERQRLNRLRQSYAFKYPKTLLRQKEQELDQTIDQLHKHMRRYMDQQKNNLGALHHRLRQAHPRAAIWQYMMENRRLRSALSKMMKQYLTAKQAKLDLVISRLDGLSPLKIMTKGYSLVYDQEGTKLYKSVTEIQPGESVRVRMHDGQLDCQVWGIKEEQRDA